MSNQISAEYLQNLIRKRKGGKLTDEDREVLILWKVLNSDSSANKDNLTAIQEFSSDSNVILLDGALVEVPKSKEKTVKKTEETESSGKAVMASEDLVGDTVIKTVKEAKELAISTSFSIDTEQLKAQLEAYLKLIPKEDEGYLRNEVMIMHFDDEPVEDVTVLVSAGTRVLDALIYCACVAGKKNEVIFSKRKVTSLASSIVARNIDNAKKSLKAGIVLFWTQGSLPVQSTGEKKQVPKFIRDMIYKDPNIAPADIAKQLSSVSTMKFPASVFLSVELDLLPVAVASRCKLSIAGNRAVRYAVYAHAMEKEREILTLPAEAGGADGYALLARNAALKTAKGISEFLVSLNGNHKAQARLHPAAKDRPVVKNLTLKLTRAIIQSLSDKGRRDLRKKILDTDNKAFQIDKNFFGAEVGEEIRWEILDNAEADFSDITVEALKHHYGAV